MPDRGRESPLSSRDRFASDVAASLRRTPPSLPSCYFYDALGSQLFEAICRLPWYRIARAESSLIERHGVEIVPGGWSPVHLAELGCGSGEKLALLMRRTAAVVGQVQLVDVSASALRHAAERIGRAFSGEVVLHQLPYEDGLAAIDGRRPASGPLLLLWLGSNIGNFDPPAARALLGKIRAVLRPGDGLLLGTDLVKPEADLLLAYDDPLQVTAAFNRNLLRRINEELDGTFDLAGFAHRAVWNGACRRVEMHLVSLRDQEVRIGAAGVSRRFARGDWIWTESSYKYDPDEVAADGAGAGLTPDAQWIDRDAGFALTRFLADGSAGC